MLLRAERGAGAWDEVLRLASQLSKRDAISPALAEEYKVQATVELLARSADDGGALERRWRSIAAADRVQPRIAAAGARHATALGMAALAREILENALAAEWVPQLVALYGELPGSLTAEEKTAEARARIERPNAGLSATRRAASPRLAGCARTRSSGAGRAARGEPVVRGEPHRTGRARAARRATRPTRRSSAPLPQSCRA
jgi:plasmid stability protein